MKFKLMALSLLASAALLTPMKAADKDQSLSLRVPVNAGAVTGSFDIKRFAVVNGQMNAIGVLNVTDGTKNVITTIAWPVQANSAPVSAAGNTNLAGLSAAAPIAAAACPILHLTLGPLNLNLLGLVLSIPNPIVLNITAVPGPGNLLGNLLCDVANLLNGNTALQNLVNALNQLLASL
jgi:hypothetical protein